MKLLQCEYCNKIYKREVSFIKHKCKVKERADYIKTVSGQIAYTFYDTWLIVKHKKGCKETSSFTTSRYYNAFVRFANFVRSIKGLADSDIFIDVMVSNNIDPFMWCDSIVFQQYLLCLEHATTAEHKVSISINTLDNLASIYNCDLADVFKHVHPNIILQKIKEQKLSPWMLLNSQKFHNLLATLPNDKQLYFDELIDVAHWTDQFKQDAKQLKTIRICIKVLNL